MSIGDDKPNTEDEDREASGEPVSEDRDWLLAHLSAEERLTLYRLDVPAGTLALDACFAHLAGIAPDLVTGVEAYDALVHPDDRERLTRRLEGRDVYALDYRLHHASGRWIRVRDRGEVIKRDAEGRPSSLRGFLRELDGDDEEERFWRDTQALADCICTVEDGGAPKRSPVWRYSHGSVALTGYSIDELNEYPGGWVALAAIEDRPAVEEQLRRLLDGRDPFTLEHSIVRKDGAIRWVKATPVVHRGADGRWTRCDVLVQDITDRKRGEAHQRRMEDLLRGTLDRLREAVLLVDNAGTVIAWNGAMEGITGLRREAALGRPFWEIWTEIAPEGRRDGDESQRIRLLMTKLLDTGDADWTSRPRKRSYLAQDGTERIVEDVIFPIRTEEGYLAGAVIRDLSEGIRAERAARGSERRYRILFESICDVAYVCALEPNGERGRLLDVNDAACKILERGREDLLEMTPGDIESFESRADAGSMRASLARGETVKRRLEYLTRSGLRVPVEMRARRCDWQGRAAALVVARVVEKD
ncbi:MAG: PAS domain S-box protein [Vicinamibacteria bacterium]|nr:PAS domain S-box protein [Vicinamibacteria bacterium]